jgi:class 3 adenylate cyclase
LRDGDVGGMAVHIAARVMAAAQPDEILVSRTVRDVVVGSDIVLYDRGTRSLEGVEGDWQLFAVHTGVATLLTAETIPAHRYQASSDPRHARRVRFQE